MDEEGVRDLKLHQDKYMHKIEIDYTSLIKVRGGFLTLNFLGTLVDQVTHLVRTVARKNFSLVSSRGSLSST